ncbi:probable fructokinase-7 [Medicago truncatula]|uniref:probable fructokinase-7 n=1 Tax=Medicago truncatula TaxID=3880 RepID=UPI001966ECC1|nr:probable fructokinase-7 [Medicago truncatula]
MGKGKRRSKTAAAVVDQSLPQHQKVPSKTVADVSDCPIYQQLIKLGFYLKREKVVDCLRQLGDSINGLNDLEKAEICFQKFLFSNLNSCGSGILPPTHNRNDLMLPTTSITTLDGPFILQVDEFTNLIAPRKGRMLTLSMTDGVNKVFGVENYFRPIEDIQPSSAPLGLKVKFSNVTVSKGCFWMLPENTIVLGGGLVDDDVQAGNKDEVSKPYTYSFHTQTFLENKGSFAVNLRNKEADFPITEGCSKTGGLVVCFDELLVDYICIHEPSGCCWRDLGGAIANVAVGISKLGGSSAFMSKVGPDEYGYTLVDVLKANNVDTSGMLVDSNASTQLHYVFLRADGERECWLSGNPSANMLLYSEVDRKLIKKAKIFHYGSIGLIDEHCKASYLAALSFAKTCDCILSYDPKFRLELWPSAEAARKGIMSIWNLADVIKISEDEITLLIDAGDPYDDDDVIKKLFHPTLKLLIVTSGSEGCRYYTNDFKGKVRGLNVEPVDTTGAGDAFVSGILYYIASDPSIFKDEKRLRKALYFASVCGAIMVTRRGAISALPTKDDVLQHQLL